MKRLFNLIALLIIAAGFFILIDPFIRQGQREHNAKQAVETFKLVAQDVKNENIADISSYIEETDDESSDDENSSSSPGKKEQIPEGVRLRASSCPLPLLSWRWPKRWPNGRRSFSRS